MTLFIDVVLVIALVLTLLAGFKNGFFRELFSVLGLATGIVGGMRLTPVIVARIPGAIGRSDITAAFVFLVIFLVVFFVLVFLGGLIASVWEGKSPTLLSRILGLGMGGLRGLLLLVMLAAAITFLSPWGSPTLARSRVLPLLSPGISLAAKLLPGEVGDRLRRQWDALPFGSEEKQFEIQVEAQSPERALPA